MLGWRTPLRRDSSDCVVPVSSITPRSTDRLSMSRTIANSTICPRAASRLEFRNSSDDESANSPQEVRKRPLMSINNQPLQNGVFAGQTPSSGNDHRLPATREQFELYYDI